MLKLKKLTFCNIGRFVEEQTIDFTQLNSLIQIDAQNNNTGGSSGSGKSTIFNALDYLLGLSDISTSTLQSRLTKNHISVNGEFEWDGKKVLVNRAKKLSVTIDENEVVGSSKLAEEALDSVIGMPRNLFRCLLHKRQGEQGFFLQMTPSKMNDFLVDTLGLSSIRSKVELVEGKIRDTALAKGQAESSLEAARAALNATQEAINLLGDEPSIALTETALAVIREHYEEATGVLAYVTNYNKSLRADLEAKKPIPKFISFDRSKLQELESKQKSAESKINEINDQENQKQLKINEEISNLKHNLALTIAAFKAELTELSNSQRNEYNKENSNVVSRASELASIIRQGDESKGEAVRLATQIKTLRNGTCHTCEQAWITEAAKDEEVKLLEKFDIHKTNVARGLEAAKEREELLSKSLKAKEELEKYISDLISKYSYRIDEATKDCENKIAILTSLTLLKTPSPELMACQSILLNIKAEISEEKKKEEIHAKDQHDINNEEMKAFFLKQKELSDSQEKELRELTEKIDRLRKEYEAAEFQFKSHKEALGKYKSSLSLFRAKESDHISKLGELSLKANQLNQEFMVAEEVKRCLKSYLSCSFDDALDSISDTATRILRAVPTMVNAAIRLEGTKETNAGAVKEQINACLDNDGELEIPIKSLSGGEKSAVDLAIDLAVGTLIQEKANKGIDILCLDECFNGFDSNGIEHALEMLKVFAIDKRIMIVEHDGVAKEFIQDRITVVRDQETSYIK